ncbi:MAG: MotA/TolQ/ExbB proton channel family protein [Pseudanabaenaceae cyanobacterium]|jgi:biopolymer transport protein ExbB
MIELVQMGGWVMYPLLFLSVLSLTGIIERSCFWFSILRRQKVIIQRLLEIARQDLTIAANYAGQCSDKPIARFAYQALSLTKPDPDLFRLCLEASADDELSAMLKGEKVLEAAITLGPLLGLLGTVIGLMQSFGALKVGDVAANLRSGSITQGIGEALITTATGLTIAIFASAFHRLFLAFHGEQMRLFLKIGNELEIIYRQQWADQNHPKNHQLLTALPPQET